MLILCSNGLSSEKLRTAIRNKMNVCKTAALVVTADYEYKEKNYHVSRCVEELEQLDLHIDMFDLDKQSAELVNYYSPEMNFLQITDLRGLVLTNIEVLPHYSKFIKRFEHFEETCVAYEKKNHVNVIRINDGDGVILDAEEIHICMA